LSADEANTLLDDLVAKLHNKQISFWTERFAPLMVYLPLGSGIVGPLGFAVLSAILLDTTISWAQQLEHFKCYEAFGDPLDINIAFADQFQGLGTLLADPFMFRNPVEKNGEPIQNSDGHLACFSILPPGQPLGFPVPIVNQFFPNSINIQVEEPIAFCLPSKKRLPEGGPTGSTLGMVVLTTALLFGVWVMSRRRRARVSVA
jgi:hypothetical protein